MNNIFELNFDEITLVSGGKKRRKPAKPIVVMPTLFQDILNNIRNNMGFGQVLLLGIIVVGMKFQAGQMLDNDGIYGWRRTIMSFGNAAFHAFAVSLALSYFAKKFT